MQAKISYLFALFCLLHLLKNAKAGNIELIEQCFENENDIEYGFCEGITEKQHQRVDIECIMANSIPTKPDHIHSSSCGTEGEMLTHLTNISTINFFIKKALQTDIKKRILIKY